MSTARKVPGPDGPAAGEKVVLRRRGPDLWRMSFVVWAGDQQIRWKALAMLSLSVHCNWSLQMIGLAFGQHRGRVCRLIQNARRQIAAYEPEESVAATENATDPEIPMRDGLVRMNTVDFTRLMTLAAKLRLGPAATLRRCLQESETFTGLERESREDGATIPDMTSVVS